MSDTFNEADFERVQAELEKLVPALQKYRKAQEDAADAEEKDVKAHTNRIWQFNRSLETGKESISAFTGGLDGVLTHLTKSILSPLGSKAFIGIAAFSALWKAGSELNDTWKDLSERGDQFGGSMFTMMQAANNAGMPLETFAKLQKGNNVLINATGKQFWQVNKQLSSNILKSGMYGMSLEQLGTFTGEYMEVSRRNGSLQTRSVGQVVGEMDNLAQTTTALAFGSDKAREEIAKLATSAMSSAFALAGMASLPLEVRGSVNKAVSEMTTVLASLPGEAGKFMSQFAADATGISSVFTSGGKTVIEAGLSGLASQMDATAAAVKDGRINGTEAGIELQNKAIDSVTQNIQLLKIQAAAGNQAAAEMITMFYGQKKLSAAEIEERKQQAKKTESITALMASIGTIWEKIKTAFGGAFGDAFSKAFGSVKDLADSPVFKHMIDLAGVFGERLGTLLGGALTADNINSLMSGIEGITVGLIDFVKSVMGAQSVWSALGWVAWGLMIPLKLLGKAFDIAGPKVTAAVGAVVGALLLFKGIKSMFGKLFGRDMVINAKNVIVNGGSSLGGEMGDILGGGKGSKMSRLGKLMGRGWKSGGVMGALKMGAGGVRGMARQGIEGGLEGLRGLRGAGMKGLLKGAGGLLGGAGGGLLKGGARLLGRAAPLLGVGLEGMDYITGEKALNWRNLAKSGLGLAGGAIGGVLGSAAGPLGTFAGGAGGYAGGKALGDLLLGSDSPAHSAAKASTKAADAATAAAAGIAATTASLTDGSNDSDDGSGTPAVDPMQTLIEEVKQMRMAIMRAGASTDQKLDAANRLLSKIEVSAQSL